jgi:hypothetical protein
VPADPEEALEPAAAARYLGRSLKTLERLVRLGDLEAKEWPEAIRRRELEAFIERQRVRPGGLAHCTCTERLSSGSSQ